MYQEQRLVFYYAISPVHMGAGSAAGAIDNPIQREVHTNHPILSGSGIKGAVRHHCEAGWGASANGDLSAIFGPSTESSDHAGAVSFTDAQIVAFPVRSLKEGFVYATSPGALARLKRIAGDSAEWAVPSVKGGEFVGVTSNHLTIDGKLVLESFEFDKADADADAVASWLAKHALPPGRQHEFFSRKLLRDLVILNDTDFSHFVDHSTVVEPHVRINNETGTAESGGLFYTENLPPETLLVGQILCTVERTKKKSGAEARRADQLLQVLLDGDKGIDGKVLQVGGDATTGRGLLIVNAQLASNGKGAVRP